MRETILFDRNKNRENSFNYQRFYPYHTKPKAMLILKKVIGSLVSLTLFLFIGSNLLGMFWNKTTESIYAQVLERSIFYLYPFISLYVIYKSFRTPEYDSEKYSASLFYIFLVIGYNAFWTWNLLELQEVPKIRESNSFEVWKILNLLEIILIGITISLLFVLFIIRPKIDQEKVRKIQNEIKKKAMANIKGEEYEIDLTGLD